MHISKMGLARSSKFYLVIILCAVFQLSAIQNSSEVRYLYQPGTPVAINDFLQIEESCVGMEIAGQVFNNNEPTEDLIIKVSGSLGAEDDILIYAISGGEPRLGPSGYRINLSDQLEHSTNSVFIQLINSSGVSISPSLPVETYDDCDQNLIIVNFIYVPTGNDLFLPLIVQSY
jgi:hypothetical protein